MWPPRCMQFVSVRHWFVHLSICLPWQKTVVDISFFIQFLSLFFHEKRLRHNFSVAAFIGGVNSGPEQLHIQTNQLKHSLSNRNIIESIGSVTLQQTYCMWPIPVWDIWSVCVCGGCATVVSNRVVLSTVERVTVGNGEILTLCPPWCGTSLMSSRVEPSEITRLHKITLLFSIPRHERKTNVCYKDYSRLCVYLWSFSNREVVNTPFRHNIMTTCLIPFCFLFLLPNTQHVMWILIRLPRQ